MSSSTEKNFTSYDLITDDLVKEALKSDLGPEAKLISWETKDFTNKGDNYSSIVTSIAVKYEENAKASETSYVAKLNPLRPESTLTEFMENMYTRETFVLREILGEINVHLQKLDQPAIRAPKLYARSLEKGKEVFVTENLREQGFKMHDRTKGLNIKHALLVLEELGRFHASSFLYEETLRPKTIPEVFNYFEEPWHDISHPSHEIFSTMMKVNCQNACDFLRKAPNYEKAINWLTKNLDSMGKLMLDCYVSSDPFAILTHGDCWTNNLLFKYDKTENPVDIRFVDLQCSRRASPACDLLYFFYSSLNGEVRKEHMKTMETIYYKSFSKIFELAGKEPPFTSSEFENEMHNRRVFGLLAGILLLPAVLAEGDEILELDNFRDENFEEFVNIHTTKFDLICERGGSFKDRFLSMFDEMNEYKLFDH